MFYCFPINIYGIAMVTRLQTSFIFPTTYFAWFYSENDFQQMKANNTVSMLHNRQKLYSM